MRRSWKVLLAQAFRRYFINTVFDSTFVAMGIVVASVAAPTIRISTVVGTMFAATLALGISTGTSVYEAEKVEAEIRLRELEEAMLTELSGTEAKRALDASRYLVVAVNVLAPLTVFALTASPFLLAGSFSLDPVSAAYMAAVLALAVLFGVGAYLGRLAGRRFWFKGLRMVVIGGLTFGAIWLIQTFFGA